MSETNQEDRSERIPVRVTPSTKSAWEDAIEETPHSGLSPAIRAAMHSEFLEDETEEQPNRPPSEIEFDLGPVEDKLESIVDQLNSLDERLFRLEQRGAEASEIPELAGSIFDLLPVYTAPEEFTDLSKASILDDEKERAKEMSTAQAYADYLSAQESDVREALELLRSEQDRVKSIETHGFSRYYREYEDMDAYIADRDEAEGETFEIGRDSSGRIEGAFEDELDGGEL